MDKNDFFRDTKNIYLKATDYTSNNFIKFVTGNAGKKILDIGCATGEYLLKLNKLGYEFIGIDVNPEYILKAKEKGLNVYNMNAVSLNFEDKQFDTVLLFEILEHVNNPEIILNEARRVAKKNILVTVPNCTQFFSLLNFGLTYDHFLELDHVNFFTKTDFESLLSKSFNNFKIEEKEPLRLGAINLPGILKYPILAMYKLKLIKSNVYYRLYATIEVE